MLVVVLFVISFIIAGISFISSRRKLLSPLFLSSGVISVFCGIYIFSFRMINSDIGYKTVVAVLFMLIATGGGEWLANRIGVCDKALKREISSLNISDVVISKKRTYLIFILEVYAGISRFIRLYMFTRSVGNTSFFKTLSVARAYLAGAMQHDYKIDLTTPDVSIISYLAEPIAYFYVFWFMYCFIIKKQKKMYCLLPVVGDAFILASSTSRTVFIVIATAFITSYAYWDLTRIKKRQINKKLIGYGTLFIAVFFIYGKATRGGGVMFGAKEIYASSAAGLYGLTEYFKEPWEKNELFGQRTLKPLYDIIGNDISVKTNNTVLSFYVWGYNTEDYSNIYSSLALPIHDFGMFGMFIVRFVIAIIAISLIKMLVSKDVQDPVFYILLFYVNQFVYSYMSCMIADRFYAFLTNVRLFMINIVFTYIAIKYVVRWNGALERV